MKRTVLGLLLSITFVCGVSTSFAVEKGIDFVYAEGEGKLNHVNRIEKLNVLSNLHVPKAIFMGLINGQGSYYDALNDKFAVDLYNIIYKINKKQKLEDSIYGMNQSIDFVVTGTARKIKELKKDIKRAIGASDSLKYLETITLPSNKPLYDRWFQDWGEFVGYGKDSNGDLVHGIYYVNRGRGLKAIVQEISKMLAVPFITSESYTQSGGDYGGNLEVTPDGIIFYGDTMTESQVNQLSKYGNRGKMVELKTNWLSVGHVDEMFSVIPSLNINTYPSSYKGPKANYGFVAADPIYGLNVIYKYKAKYKESISYSSDHLTDSTSRYYIKSIQKAISKYIGRVNGNFTAEDLDSRSYNSCISDSSIERKYCDLIEYNIKVNRVIKNNLKKFIEKTPTENDNILNVPQIYRQVRNKYGQVTGGVSFLPGTANMVIIRDNVIVPNPTFEPYRKIVEEMLNAELGGTESNSKVHFIMEKREYHDLMGEVHCGTNVMREPLLIRSNI